MSSQSYIFNPTERTLAAAGDGFSCPRLTTAGRTALALTAGDKGMMVYDTTLTDLCIWNGSAWEFVNDNSNGIPSVKDYGAIGDGVTNDRAAIQAAFNANKQVYFPSGTYFVGSYSGGEKIIDLSALGDGITIFCGKSVELVCQSTANVSPQFFYLLRNSKFTCGPISFRDTGYDPAITWKGALCFLLDNGTGASDNWGDINLECVYARNVVSVVTVAGGDATHRIRGIRIGQLFADDCYYGFNAANQGDGVQIENLISYQNYRPYFVYGVADHKVKVFNRANRNTSGAINISRSVGGLNTKGIDVSYVARDMTVGITHVLINHIDLLGGTIADVKVNVDIESTVIYNPIRFVNYTGSGGAETNAASANLVYDITLTGSCDVQALDVTAFASYAGKRRLNFTSGASFIFDSTIPAKFYLNYSVRNEAVTWTASTTNPVLGNGTLLASYDVIDGVVHYNLTLTAGSTTTFGTGDWLFALPALFTPTVGCVGSSRANITGVYYTGSVLTFASSQNIALYANAAGTGFGSTSPAVWTNGSTLLLSVTYPYC